jgi:hypothetical protein
MRIDLPEPSLVVLMGASGSGKSTFSAAHFAPTEVISSDFCRALVADDPNDQAATEDAFAVLHEIAGRRLARGRLTVVTPRTSSARRARRSSPSRASTTCSLSRSCSTRRATCALRATRRGRTATSAIT